MIVYSLFHRFLLHLSCQSSMLEGPANFSVVETNAFKHLNHLSLRLVQGSDKEIKDYLAVCLSSLKVCLFNIIHPHNSVWYFDIFVVPCTEYNMWTKIQDTTWGMFFSPPHVMFIRPCHPQSFRLRGRPWRQSLRRLKTICPDNWVMLNRCAVIECGV